MSAKRKGIRKEWELRKLLVAKGYLVLRSSASRTGVDILAGNGEEVIAFQVQSTPYIPEEKLKALEKYAKAFKAKAVIAVKIKGKWFFAEVGKLKKTKKGWKIPDDK